MKWQARRELFWQELGLMLETEAGRILRSKPEEVPPEEIQDLVEWLSLLRAMSLLVEQQARLRIAALEALRGPALSTVGAVPRATRARSRRRHRVKAAEK
jgi:hypothetical protein